ncbi:MAG TPA: CRISPR-associated endonuclease Cas2 [Anaerolineales bacterium]|nr:CRISPR-associated endonuclease Cas2 [Anaerolineales bacterium]
MDDRRRTRLHKHLLKYGTPVQYSVFECWLSATQWRELQKQLPKWVKAKDDNLRCYVLCGACVGKRLSIPPDPPPSERIAIIV